MAKETKQPMMDEMLGMLVATGIDPSLVLRASLSMGRTAGRDPEPATLHLDVIVTGDMIRAFHAAGLDREGE